MRKLKKAIIGVLASAMLMGAMTGCGKAASDDITVISREDGSGTRGAFIELFGIEEKQGDEKVSRRRMQMVIRLIIQSLLQISQTQHPL